MSVIPLPEDLLHQLSATAMDYAELTKLRITALIALTAWVGYFFAARQAGVPVLSWGLLHALLGISLVAGGTAALNEVMECDIDRRMRRTTRRPLPAGRMRLLHAALVGLLLTLGGSAYLWVWVNLQTAALTFLTSAVYLLAYTPLKRVSSWCTFVGAFPGAMPCVLGWSAVQGKLGVETVVLFSVVFLWQFPHFFSIAWLYRDDYAAGGIRMLPVVEPDGRSTRRNILAYSIALLPMSLLPAFLGMTGRAYLLGAALLSAALLYFSYRLVVFPMPPDAAHSRQRARQLLQASVIYLPLLLTLMMANAKN